MEKILMDILNAGIAAFQSGESKLKQSLADLEKLYEELRAKGSQDQSEQANRFRDLVQKTVSDAQSKLQNANAETKEIYQQLKENFEKISLQVNELLPEDLKAKAKSAIDELSKLTKKQ
ncbi:hypothetical protein LEP1GSC047_2517 [Leptospira inadai serovar Lyme str. 10]|uniref:Chemotaxis protein n=2 Tax=Leptospira inadai serovar Lyme TaxID=293084 RepID=V6HUU5_9LEPT|nr:hypothetical protein [Leptospira inadai]EQA36564.1 hypothetical protein LEP1GSC047_2517 [Leptospira inadai serovar Lyme str. 10]PNV75694.1 hypothetical protein BES34_006540 [Leptospira inadai serovar Lyme]